MAVEGDQAGGNAEASGAAGTASEGQTVGEAVQSPVTSGNPVTEITPGPVVTPPPKTHAPKKVFVADMHSTEGAPLDQGFVVLIDKLQTELKMPVMLLVQNGDKSLDKISDSLYARVHKHKSSLPLQEPIALLIDSPGGSARASYKLGMLLRRKCGGYKAVVPQFAKSAAALLALGADSILMAEDAELGPLDAQFIDMQREEHRSALDEVQSLERLFAASLDAVDQTMQLLIQRTGKKTEVLLEPTLHYVAEMMAPLFRKIDTVHYTSTSRMLKVAEEYATRLMCPKYSPDLAKKIARHLVEKYPEHGFVIDTAEAESLKLAIQRPSPGLNALLEQIAPYLNERTMVGFIREVTP